MGTVATDGAGAFLGLLALEQPEPDLFRGVSHEGAPLRAFGGHVAAHALVAATSTVGQDRPVHSLHSYFVRGGDPTRPIDYHVDRIRDGRSFSTRRITAVQHDEAIFVLSASFHRHETSPVEHQRPAPLVPAPPDGLPLFDGRPPPGAEPADAGDDAANRRAGERREAWSRRGFEVREVSTPTDGARPAPGRMQAWLRVTDRLPDDQHTHAAALVYMSDLTLSHSILSPHGGVGHGMQMTSLDHAVWFHRPFRADTWLLFDQESPTAANARGLAIGEFFDAAGTLVATVVQEALVRPPR